MRTTSNVWTDSAQSWLYTNNYTEKSKQTRAFFCYLKALKLISPDNPILSKIETIHSEFTITP